MFSLRAEATGTLITGRNREPLLSYILILFSSSVTNISDSLALNVFSKIFLPTFYSLMKQVPCFLIHFYILHLFNILDED
jgi:hypothetical protein